MKELSPRSFRSSQSCVCVCERAQACTCTKFINKDYVAIIAEVTLMKYYGKICLNIL